MTRDDYARLQGQAEVVPMIAAAELTDQSDRTLLWGYDIGRRSWHVFLRDGQLEHVVYSYPDELIYHARAAEMAAEKILPNKRLYPEACDFNFCRLLESKGIWLPFTSFNGERPPVQFHGLVPPSPSSMEAGR